ncbi:MAG: hypothetical protein KUG75_11915 [Pseudomonadales bacterium]|nr:hypothetical protein [Pseudomonadales bacterium]
MSFLLRIFLRSVVVIALLIAMLQGGGRLSMFLLENMEPRINRALEESGTVLEGLSGSWQGFNPVLKLERVRFTGGNAGGIYFELDVLHSLLRNRVVAAQLRVDELNIAITRDVQGGLTLLGRSVGKTNFDFKSFLEYSAEVYLRQGRIYPVVQDVSEETAFRSEAVTISALLQSIDGYRGQIYISTQPASPVHSQPMPLAGQDCDQCEFRLQYDIAPGAFFPGFDADNVGITKRAMTGIVEIFAENFIVSEALGALWQVSGEIQAMAGRLDLETAGGDGHLSLALENLDLPFGQLDSVELNAQLFIPEARDRLQAVVKQLTSRPGGSLVEDMQISLSRGAARDEGGPYVSLSIPFIDLSEIGKVGRELFSATEAVPLWLNGLQIKGQLSRFELQFGLGTGGLGYSGNFQGIYLNPFKGVPLISNATGNFIASRSAVDLNLDAENMHLGFKKLFSEAFALDSVEGSVLIYYQPGYVGIVGHDLFIKLGDANVEGGFAITRTEKIEDQHLLVQAQVERLSVLSGKQFLPFNLQQNVKTWLEDAAQDGEINSGLFIYHGAVRAPPSRLSPRQVVMHLNVSNAEIAYEPSWPSIDEMSGDIYLTPTHIEAKLVSAKSLSIALSQVEVLLPRSAAYVEFSALAQGDLKSALAFIRQSPLSDSLSFIDQSWAAGGNMAFRIAGSIPVTEPQRALSAAVNMTLEDAFLDMPDIGLQVSALHGSVEYAYPHNIKSSDLTGSMFDNASTLHFETRDDVIHLNTKGRASIDNLSEWLEVNHAGLAKGEMGLETELLIYPASERSTTLSVFSTLEGVSLDLPAELYKTSEDVWEMRVNAGFSDSSIMLDMDIFGVADAWWLFEENIFVKGSLGIGEPPLALQDIGDEFVITGKLSSLDLSAPDENSPSGQSGGQNDSTFGEEITFPWSVHNLLLAEVGDDELVFDNVMLQGRGGAGSTELTGVSRNLTGSYTKLPDLPPKLHIARLFLPEETELPQDELAIVDAESTLSGVSEDPLIDFNIDRLVDIDVVIDQIFVGEENYGAWAFDIRRSDDFIAFLNVEAEMKGLNIRSETGLVWQTLLNRTVFDGVVDGGDLADILPRWDYAPSMRSKKLRLNADLSWPGSPLNFTLEELDGILSYKLTDGEFVDLEGATGPLRILTLMNFNKAAKRLSGNFTDVFGKGIEFDKVSAVTEFDSGKMTFIESMKVSGSSGKFEIMGDVDLKNNTLNNTMIVTLPVTKGLPWYAAWAAVANPVVGLGILVGGKIIEKPLDMFSSARYQITGTLDNPKVEFDGLFTNNMQSDLNEVQDSVEEKTMSDDTVEKKADDSQSTDNLMPEAA